MAEKFEIKNPYERLTIWQHPISTDHIVIKIEEWEDDNRDDAEVAMLLSLKTTTMLKDILEYWISKISKETTK